MQDSRECRVSLCHALLQGHPLCSRRAIGGDHTSVNLESSVIFILSRDDIVFSMAERGDNCHLVSLVTAFDPALANIWTPDLFQTIHTLTSARLPPSRHCQPPCLPSPSSPHPWFGPCPLIYPAACAAYRLDPATVQTSSPPVPTSRQPRTQISRAASGSLPTRLLWRLSSYASPSPSPSRSSGRA
jgi:hypothetical protein